MTLLSFETVKDYTDYISRLHQLPRVFDETIDNMRLGMADGMMPPKFLLEKAVDQTTELANTPIDKSPFAQPFDKFPASFSDTDKTRLKKDGLDAIQKDVVPAYQKLAKFLKDNYAPKGRTEVGIWALPNGDAIYRFMVREATTTDIEPEKIHEIGLQQVAEIEKQQLAIAQKLGYKDLKSSLRRLLPTPICTRTPARRFSISTANISGRWSPSCRNSSAICRRPS